MKRLLFLTLALCACYFSSFASSQTTVNPAIGGTNICSNNAGSVFTTLGNITIGETNLTDFGSGTNTLTLSPPAGWVFDASATVTLTPSTPTDFVTTTGLTGSFTDNTHYVISVTMIGSPTAVDNIVIGGLSVQASSTGSLTGNITGTQSGGFTGITGATNFGTLSLLSAGTPTVSIGVSPSNTICSGASTTFTATPASLGSATATYQWSNNSTPITGATNATYTSSSLNNGDVINCTINTIGGCLNPTSATSSNITMIVNAIPTAITGGNIVCYSSTLNLTETATGGTWYSTRPTIATVAGTGVVTALSTQDTVTIVYSNGCGSDATTIISINATPTVSISNYTSPTSKCTGNTINLIAGAKTGVGTLQSYNWSGPNGFSAITGTGTETYTLTSTAATGIYSLTVTYPGAGCVSNFATTALITVNQTPDVTAITNDTLCAGNATPLFHFTGVGSGVTYTWVGSNTLMGNTTSTSTGDITSYTALNDGTGLASTETYTVTASTVSCPGSSTMFTVTVYSTSPTITVVPTSANDTFCSDVINAYLPITGTATAFMWSNSVPSIGLPNSFNTYTNITHDTAFFTSLNTGTSDVVALISVIPMYGTCSGTSATFNVIVHPRPNVTIMMDALTFTGDSLCNGQHLDSIMFSDLVSTGYSWASNTNIGIGTSGTGDSIGSFNANNSGIADVVAIFTVTPWYNTCSGANSMLTIKVHPTPTVSVSGTSTTDTLFYCNGANSSFTFVPNSLNTVYNWTNNNASIGIALSGSNNNATPVYTFTATNTDTTEWYATITNTPMIADATIIGGGCYGAAYTFYAIVHPTPSVNTTNDTVLCSAATMPQINFSGYDAANTTYHWSNTKSSVGMPATSGISNNIASFTAIKAGAYSDSAVIVVTPYIGACHNGVNNTFKIVVHPLPYVTNFHTATYCNDYSSVSFYMVDTVLDATTAYSWSTDNRSIFDYADSLSLISGNTKLIPSFTTYNAGNTVLSTVFTIIATANNCTSTVMDTLNVNPVPNVSSITSATFNTGQNIPNTTFVFTGSTSALNTTYTWTNNGTSIGLVSADSGMSLDAFTAYNGSNTDTTATIVVTPKIGTCVGTSPVTFNITVHPVPTVHDSTNRYIDTICNGLALYTKTIIDAGNSVDSIVWAFSNMAIDSSSSIPDSIATMAIVSGVNKGTFWFVPTMNTGSDYVTSTYTITPIKAGVRGTPIVGTLLIQPTPNMAVINSAAYVNDSTTATIVFSALDSGLYNYSWTNTNTTIGLANSNGGLNTISSFTAINAGVSDIIDTITVMPFVYLSTTGRCYGNSVVFHDTIHPTSSVTLSFTPVNTFCSWDSLKNMIFSNPVSGTIDSIHYLNRVIGMDSMGSTIGLTANSDSLANYALINLTDSVIIDTFVIIPYANNVKGNTTTFYVTVNPIPRMATLTPSLVNQVKCNGQKNDTINFRGVTAWGAMLNTYHWKINNDIDSIGVASVGVGDSFIQYSLANTGLVHLTDSFIVVAYIGACHNGDSQRFSIRVNPTPKMTNTAKHICSGTAILDTFHSLATELPVAYTWARIKNRNILQDTSSSSRKNDSTISEVMLTNDTTVNVYVTYTVSLTTNSGTTCASDTSIVDTVYPKPMMTLSTGGTHSYVCDNSLQTIKINSSTPNCNYFYSGGYLNGNTTTLIPYTSYTVTGTDTVRSETLANSRLDSTVFYVYSDSISYIGACSAVYNDTVYVRPLAHLVTTRDTICSDDKLNFTPHSTVVDQSTNYTWNTSYDAQVSVIQQTNAVGNTNGVIINNVISSGYYHYLDSAKFNYTLSVPLDATGGTCTNNDVMTVIINPRPAKPQIVRNFDNGKIYEGMKHQNFGTIMPADISNNLCYHWVAGSGIAITDTEKPFAQNILLDFDVATISQEIVLYDSAFIAGYSGCAVTDSLQFNVKVQNSTNPNPTISLFNNRLICNDNSVDHYLWGIDDKTTLQSAHLLNISGNDEINQDCYVGNDGNHPLNTAKYNYWVIATANSDSFCKKVYYDPTAPKQINNKFATNNVNLSVYPNPADKNISVEYKDFLGDNLTVEIFDMMGRKVRTADMSDYKATLQLDGLPIGNFLVVCFRNGNKVASTQFVKN